MNRLNVRFFSIGMLVASIIIFLYGFFFENDTAKSEPTAEKEGYTLVEKDRLDLFKEKIAGLEAENTELKKNDRGKQKCTNEYSRTRKRTSIYVRN
ncbi:hypothetical protein [Caldifermentibacillus hisashii]|uniref:hypothetical protein n=1 Tax=Caldifermentibacillus hisashii TaxID=996558 RepID=UPI000BA37FAE|nr:hypothetical protein [Caldifermentibacillus hisashii]PAC37576.1 hypothetical protein CEJ87_02625 [Caldifermentibacillus hisashii]